MKKRLILFSHGSRDPRWRQPFEDLFHALQGALGDDAVRNGYMEVASPTLDDLAAEAKEQGFHELVLLPLFMAGGGHVAHDIPRLVRAAEQAHPPVRIRILPAIGEHPKIAEFIARIAADAFRESDNDAG
ncbi:MAG: CbiX/SirB N-terminal domain-containing protein [Deltaproteobacteria bacterium]|nr:CbiX/SirB N-terminal domain-containing protein [Deltaproteobacteria bacterium]MCB9489623.1 CbiX/SirB N-terminal domain-containing protein [Deltaproteobacteria bacterium]